MNLERFINRPIPPMGSARLDFELPDAPENGEPIVDITEIHPRIRFAASYLKAGVDGALTRCYVRRGVYERLCAALDLLPKEYSFLIYDTLRPLRVQKALFEDYIQVVAAQHPGLSRAELEDITDEFVARPVCNLRRPSSHQSGGAVDLTLCKDGEELDMGTVFDEFAEIAHADYFEAPGRDPHVRDNRRLLHNVLREVGFTHYESEWWHFDYGDGPWARRNRCAPLYDFCAEETLK